MKYHLYHLISLPVLPRAATSYDFMGGNEIECYVCVCLCVYVTRLSLFPKLVHKIGSTQLSRMSSYAVALQFPFIETKGLKHVPASEYRCAQTSATFNKT